MTGLMLSFRRRTARLIALGRAGRAKLINLGRRYTSWGRGSCRLFYAARRRQDGYAHRQVEKECLGHHTMAGPLLYRPLGRGFCGLGGRLLESTRVQIPFDMVNMARLTVGSCSLQSRLTTSSPTPSRCIQPFDAHACGRRHSLDYLPEFARVQPGA